ncbi:MAG: ATP-binding protein [Bacteroidetes bacterium]|nr:MAG: ATP-binding protein [Bacteroidota bacterium]
MIRSIYYEGELALDQKSMRKRIVLKRGESLLPIMTWSTGQREFMPLLLGLYWLMPSSKISKKKELQWVVVEEPEMGLHPEAIQAFLLLVLEMMRRGYKILISTHSPLVLDLVWTLRNLKAEGASEEPLFRLFQVKKTPRLREIFRDVLQNRSIKTFFFRREGTAGAVIEDISELDPYSEREFEADWGGLTAFTSRSSEVLSEFFATIE